MLFLHCGSDFKKFKLNQNLSKTFSIEEDFVSRLLHAEPLQNLFSVINICVPKQLISFSFHTQNKLTTGKERERERAKKENFERKKKLNLFVNSIWHFREFRTQNEKHIKISVEITITIL
jgi:hypothetical protein